jgi:excisionase family DNA binding protein
MSRPHFAQDPVDPLLTTREAALRLGVSLRTVQLWVEAGTLPAGRTPGGHRRIRLSAVEALAQRSGLRPPAPSQLVHAAPADDTIDILLVAATADQRHLWETALAPMGSQISVRSADNGYTGLLQLGRKVPRLLITDLVMPDVDGYAMLRTLAGMSEYADMHVLALTSLSPASIAERGGVPPQVQVQHHLADATTLRRWVEGEITRISRLDEARISA